MYKLILVQPSVGTRFANFAWPNCGSPEAPSVPYVRSFGKYLLQLVLTSGTHILLFYYSTLIIIFLSYSLVPRDNIESTHGDEISSIRSHYTDEDNKLITNFLHLKKHSNPAQEQEENGQNVQEETDHEGLSIVLRIVLKVCPP